MKQKRNALVAAVLAVLMLLSVATAAFAAESEPTEPALDQVATEPPAEEPSTEEPTTEPTTKTPTQPSTEPTTEKPTQPTTKPTQPTTKPAPHTHKYGKWTLAKKATNKKNGRYVRVCSCGKKETKTIARVKSATLKYKQFVYTGSPLTNKVTLKDKAGKTLKQGKAYTVSYKNNVRVGIATVVIKGTGNYKFKTTRSFRIVPMAVALTGVTPSATKATVNWNHVPAQASGYQLQYTTDPAFSKNLKLQTRGGGLATSDVLSGLTEKTTYYVRVRTFKYTGDKYYYAAWSKPLSFTTPAAAPYAIAGQLPRRARVASSYFDDAVFVGDSVSLGLSYYEAANDVLGKAQFLTAGSLGSGNALGAVTESSVHPRYNGQKMKVEKGVAACGAKKVYIMLGMNDIGAYGVDKSVANFKTLCQKILKEAPGVKLYVQSVTPRVAQGAKSDNVTLNNTNITAYNRKLASLCAQQGWYFVNVAEVMFDSTGHLIRSYCSDPDGMGMHFAYAGCKVWVDYLYTHTA